MENIIIMYHYVRNNKNFKAINPSNFNKQINFFQKKFKIISLQRLFENQSVHPTCILSFDDGLKDGITEALPILKKNKVPAIFFIPTRILTNKSLIPAQKRHLLLAKIGVEKLVLFFNQLVNNQYKIRLKIPSNGLDNQLVTNLKYGLDHYPPVIVNVALNKIFKQYFNETEEFDNLYLNIKDIIYLKKLGMEIGIHGHQHTRLNNLNSQKQESDLTSAITIFKKNLGFTPKYISYPFGSFNKTTERLVKKLGMIAGITTRKVINRNLKHPYRLGRFDCIDFYPFI